jgi:hypothetical protein
MMASSPHITLDGKYTDDGDAEFRPGSLESLCWEAVAGSGPASLGLTLLAIRHGWTQFLARAELPRHMDLDMNSGHTRVIHTMSPLEFAAARGELQAVIALADRFSCEHFTMYAATCGHIHVLAWAKAHDHPFSDLTWEYAAAGGQVATLQWAVAHDYALGAMLCLYASFHGRVEVLEWMQAAGVPWGRGFCLAHGTPEIRAWVANQPE